MLAIYVDPFSGIAGDMLLGALLDAGLAEARLRQALAALPLEGYRLAVGREERRGLAAARAEVRLAAGADQPHRRLADIERLLAAAPLPGAAAATARAVFRRLAEAEAKVHGCAPEEVHFHEVGAVDSIVDIVGACAGLALLGVERVIAGPVPTGSGTVETAHGRLPVPAPATLELLRGVPTRASDEPGELTTPTGAALLAVLAERFGPMPAMTVEAVGYGAGSRQGQRLPNVLRVVLGQLTDRDGDEEADTVWLLEANLDDAGGEVLGAAAEALFQAGALDVWTVPAVMKKGRPGVVLAALADHGRREAVEETMLRHTPTFGVRRRLVERTKLARETLSVETPYGPVRVKVGRRGRAVLAVHPEYDDCLRAARAAGAPLAQVVEAARDAWRRAAGAGPAA
jgi:hypothetical protein